MLGTVASLGDRIFLTEDTAVDFSSRGTAPPAISILSPLSVFPKVSEVCTNSGAK